MDKAVEICLEPKREWVTPELKKLDIDLITATMPGSGHDGGTTNTMS